MKLTRNQQKNLQSLANPILELPLITVDNE